MLDEVVNVPDVEEAVAVGPRHVPVYLGDDQLGGFNRSLGDVHRDAQAAVAIVVRRADADERDIDREAVRPEEIGHLRKEDRRVVRAGLVHGVAHAVADEERVGAEITGILGLGVRSDAERQDVDDLGVGQVVAIGRHRPHQLLRLAAGRPDEHAVAGADSLHRVGGGNDLACVEFTPFAGHW